MERRWVTPNRNAEGQKLIVRDPMNNYYELPPEGAEVVWNSYWAAYEAEGSIAVKKVDKVEEAPRKAPPKESR